MSAQPLDDPRYARTRQALLSALVALPDDEIAQLSAGSLTRAAGVARASFYNHFSTLPEAATQALGAGMREIMRQDTAARLAGAPAERVALETSARTLGFLADHRGLYLLASDWRSPSGLRGIADVLVKQMHEYREQFGGDSSAGRPAGFVDAEDIYVASAIEGFYAAVLHGSLAIDPATASRMLYELFPAWMRTPG